MEIPNLFHFVATYADGSQIWQNPDDRSEKFPDKNCFFEVLERIREGEQPVSFVLRNEELDQAFGIDLRDGHFEVNTFPFFQHRPEHQPYKDFRLIYFRTPQVEVEVNSKTGESKPVRGRIASYTIGWQTTFKGENIQRTFTVYFD